MQTGRIFSVLIFICTAAWLQAQNVGIGTTTPTEKLHVEGNTYTTGITRTEGFAMGGLNTFNVNTQTIAGGRFFIGTNGFVGIGTNTPSQKLEVQGTIRAWGLQLLSGSFPGFILQTDAGGNTSWVDPASIFSNSWTVNGPNQYAALNGNVGIGTDNPTGKLTVAGNIEIKDAGQIFLENSNVRGLNTLEGSMGLYLRPSLGSPHLVNIDPNGGVGIGIGTNAPSKKLEVNGEIKAAGLQLTNAPVSGFVLKSDANGNSSWADPVSLIPAITWTASGNNQFSALSGNVGIGTNAPSKKLEVNGEVKASGLQLTNGAAAGFFLQSDAGGNASWVNPPTFDNTWTSNGTHQFSALSGNVGIGTSNPLAKLEVAGNVKISNTGSIQLENSHINGLNTLEGASGLYLRANPGNANLVNIDPNGNVGIGIGSNPPQQKLEVNGTVKSTGFQMLPGAGAGKLLQSDASGNASWVDSPSSANTWTTSGTNQFSALAGNVGIGTGTPTEKLEVTGNLKVNSGQIKLNNNHITGLNTLEGASSLYLRPGPGNASLVNIDANGSVGIGMGTAAPSYKLQVNGSVRVQDLLSVGSNDEFQVDAPGTPGGRFRISTDGKVGIQQSFPHVRLNVKGDGTDIFFLNVENAAGLSSLSAGNQFVNVSGNFSVANGSKNFVTDHPLDPANKTLRHSCIESPEVLNVYSGTVLLGAGGKATVQLPDYFEALNKDFRYQLTCVGAFAPVFVQQEVVDNQFVIAGGAEGMKISWQVTGVRNDPWFRDHPYQSVEEKTGIDKGRYYYPEGYGLPAEKAISRHIETPER